MHPVLKRQLRQMALSADAAPDAKQWNTFLQLVDSVYMNADEDRYLLEHSTEVASKEMFDLHETLAHQRDYLAHIIDILDVGILLFDSALHVKQCNSEAIRLFDMSRDTLTGMQMNELRSMLTDRHSDDLERHFPAMRVGENEDLRYRRFDNVELTGIGSAPTPISLAFIPIKREKGIDTYVVVLRDLSTIRQIERDLRNAQKLEAVGRLAAGVAHEINTPIQFVNDNLRFLLESIGAMEKALDAADRLREKTQASSPEASVAYDAELEEIDVAFFRNEIASALHQSIDGTERVATIVRAMKTFAHPGTLRVPVDINALIENTAIIARNEIHPFADLLFECETLPLINGFVQEINQVVLNLLVNAAHAIRERFAATDERGTITIRTRPQDDGIVVEITDNGSGIPADVSDKIFDPFFTTKDVGRGSGQGLSLVHNVIVENHHGTVTFHSKHGEGTTFVITMPIG